MSLVGSCFFLYIMFSLMTKFRQEAVLMLPSFLLSSPTHYYYCHFWMLLFYSFLGFLYSKIWFSQRYVYCLFFFLLHFIFCLFLLFPVSFLVSFCSISYEYDSFQTGFSFSRFSNNSPLPFNFFSFRH